MAENEPNRDKRNRSKESEETARTFRSESTNLETGTTPRADVNTSSFGGAGSRGEDPSRDVGASKPTSGGRFDAKERAATAGGTLPNANTGTQRGSVPGSNVASGTGVRRETESPQRGTSPSQGAGYPKIGGQPGAANQGAGRRPEKQGQVFNEGQGGLPGSRRTGERPEGRPEGRPEERKKREEPV